jgi:hypothetical protein
MGGDHGRADIILAKKFLDRPNILPVLQEVSREEMAEGVTTCGVGNPGCNDRLLDRTLHDRFR